MDDRQRLRRRLAVGALALGVIAALVGVAGFVLMIALGEWSIGLTLGSIGGLSGGAGCILAAVSILRGKSMRELARSQF